ncbi:MAG: hypothetical protein MI724_03920, partial [Spirochaetales bacterium]|nr:hypothetical protein [Spirochaetales bacterium]
MDDTGGAVMAAHERLGTGSVGRRIVARRLHAVVVAVAVCLSFSDTLSAEMRTVSGIQSGDADHRRYYYVWPSQTPYETSMPRYNWEGHRPPDVVATYGHRAAPVPYTSYVSVYINDVKKPSGDGKEKPDMVVWLVAPNGTRRVVFSHGNMYDHWRDRYVVWFNDGTALTVPADHYIIIEYMAGKRKKRGQRKGYQLTMTVQHARDGRAVDHPTLSFDPGVPRIGGRPYLSTAVPSQYLRVGGYDRPETYVVGGEEVTVRSGEAWHSAGLRVGGTYSPFHWGQAYSDGDYDVYVAYNDVAGNGVRSSPWVPFSIDTLPPVATTSPALPTTVREEYRSGGVYYHYDATGAPALVTWAPFVDAGAGVDRYVLTRDGVGVATIGHGAETYAYTVGEGVSGTFQLTAYDRLGHATATNVVSLAPAPVLPTPPAVAWDEAEGLLAWTNPANPGGATRIVAVELDVKRDGASVLGDRYGLDRADTAFGAHNEIDIVALMVDEGLALLKETVYDVNLALVDNYGRTLESSGVAMVVRNAPYGSHAGEGIRISDAAVRGGDAVLVRSRPVVELTHDVDGDGDALSFVVEARAAAGAWVDASGVQTGAWPVPEEWENEVYELRVRVAESWDHDGDVTTAPQEVGSTVWPAADGETYRVVWDTAAPSGQLERVVAEAGVQEEQYAAYTRDGRAPLS